MLTLIPIKALAWIFAFVVPAAKWLSGYPQFIVKKNDYREERLFDYNFNLVGWVIFLSVIGKIFYDVLPRFFKEYGYLGKLFPLK